MKKGSTFVEIVEAFRAKSEFGAYQWVIRDHLNTQKKKRAYQVGQRGNKAGEGMIVEDKGVGVVGRVPLSTADKEQKKGGLPRY